MDSFPLSHPPPGVTPNFVDPVSNTGEIPVAFGICVSLILIFSSLWFWARFAKSRRANSWLLEVLFFITVCGIISFFCIALAVTRYRMFGRHEWDTLFKDVAKTPLVLSFIGGVFIYLWLLLIKICILMLYLEIFGTLRWMKLCCRIGIIFTALWSLGGMIGWSASCSPRGNSLIAWILADVSQRCERTQRLVIFNGAMNMITDLFLIVLPIPAVWNLQMPLKQKIGLCAMFLTAIVGLIASALGFYLRVLFNQSWKSPYPDILWLTTSNYIVNMVEMTAATMAFCMPSMVSLLRKYKDKIQSTLNSAHRLLSRLDISSRHHTSSGLTNFGESEHGREDSSSSSLQKVNPHVVNLHVLSIQPKEEYSETVTKPDPDSLLVPSLARKNVPAAAGNGSSSFGTSQAQQMIQKRTEFVVEHGVKVSSRQEPRQLFVNTRHAAKDNDNVSSNMV